jgi:hypothetical protein
MASGVAAANQVTGMALSVKSRVYIALFGLAVSLLVVGGVWYWSTNSPHENIAKPTPPPKPPEVDPQVQAQQKLLELGRYSDENEAVAILKATPELAHDEKVMREVLPRQIAQGHREFVELAVQANPDLVLKAIPRKGDFATPPLHMAVEQGDLRLTQSILKMSSPGLEMSQGGAGETILQAAIVHRRLEIVRYIVDRYPAVASAKSRQGETALHTALKTRVLWEQEEIVELVGLLVTAAPNLARERDAQGKMPIDLLGQLQDRFISSEFTELKPKVASLLEGIEPSENLQ